MTESRPLLMIPGPVEISPAVLAAASEPPPGHLEPRLMHAFAEALAAMRAIWRASPDSLPLLLPGGGTLAMESAATNLVSPGERALVVSTGYFGDRMAEMLRRRGAEIETLAAPPGDAPGAAEAEAALVKADASGRPFKALFVTHVDTSTGVRIEPEAFAAAASRSGALSVFDGVCATGGERFEMAAWGADVYFTASQKALGVPAGLGLLVASPRAVAARRDLATPPPMTLDWLSWQPVHEAYEAGRPAYFSTPPTSLVLALAAGLREILAEAASPAAAVDRVLERHARAARALRAAWRSLSLEEIPARPELAADTLSALRFPAGVGAELVGEIRRRGVTVAGGLHAALAGTYFRVGHMGDVTRRREPLVRTVRAIAGALSADDDAVVERAVAAFDDEWSEGPTVGVEKGATRGAGVSA